MNYPKRIDRNGPAAGMPSINDLYTQIAQKEVQGQGPRPESMVPGGFGPNSLIRAPRPSMMLPNGVVTGGRTDMPMPAPPAQFRGPVPSPSPIGPGGYNMGPPPGVAPGGDPDILGLQQMLLARQRPGGYNMPTLQQAESFFQEATQPPVRRTRDGEVRRETRRKNVV